MIEHLTNSPSCWYPNFGLIIQQNTIPPNIIFALESSFEHHHNMWYAIILSVLPKHIQALNHDERDLLTLYRHAIDTGGKRNF